MRVLLQFFLFVAQLYSFESWNYINKNYKFTSEAALLKKYDSVISPYFYKHTLHFFITPDNVKIAYKIFKVQKSKAIIVISSGRTEGMVKYQELIYDLNQNAYDVYILDHRGQGYSQRLLEDRRKGYVDNFFHYVDDLKFFVDNYVPKDKKRILLAHSMGGAIASLYVERYPYDFNALVLSSPMHKPYMLTPNMSPYLCKRMLEKQNNLTDYMIGTQNHDILNTSFEENDLTHSKERFKIMKSAYTKEPETRIGGPTKKWVQEACKWSAESVKNADLIKIPVLVLEAQKDRAVTVKAQEDFCKNISKNCKGILLEGAYHELFIEEDIIRQKALSAILDFIAKI